MEYIKKFLSESKFIIDHLNIEEINRMVKYLVNIRHNGGRLFILGVGGGAGHASHAVNDFRKIAGFEAYSPTDNVSELTARINDDGWDTCFQHWLLGSRLNKKDGLLIFSVGGGVLANKVSVNIVNALKYAKEIGSTILGVVGHLGGYTAEVANACVKIPSIHKKTITSQTEVFQALVWHLLVSHPEIQQNKTKWENIQEKENCHHQ